MNFSNITFVSRILILSSCKFWMALILYMAWHDIYSLLKLDCTVNEAVLCVACDNRYRALYNYRPQNEDELELCEGDTVYVMEKCDDGWYVGSSQRTGYFGTFPGNYVERIWGEHRVYHWTRLDSLYSIRWLCVAVQCKQCSRYKPVWVSSWVHVCALICLTVPSLYYMCSQFF